MLILFSVLDELLGLHILFFDFVLVFRLVEVVDVEVDLGLLLEGVERVHGAGVVVRDIPDAEVELVELEHVAQVVRLVDQLHQLLVHLLLLLLVLEQAALVLALEQFLVVHILLLQFVAHLVGHHLLARHVLVEVLAAGVARAAQERVDVVGRCDAGRVGQIRPRGRHVEQVRPVELVGHVQVLRVVVLVVVVVVLVVADLVLVHFHVVDRVEVVDVYALDDVIVHVAVERQVCLQNVLLGVTVQLFGDLCLGDRRLDLVDQVLRRQVRLLRRGHAGSGHVFGQRALVKSLFARLGGDQSLRLDVFGRLGGLLDEVVDLLRIVREERLEVVEDRLGHVCLRGRDGQLVARLFEARGDHVLRRLDVHARRRRQRPLQVAPDDFDDRPLDLA